MNITRCFNIVVILNNYNKFNFVHRCVSSILNQTYKNFSLVIIDDCSNDGSFELISSFIKNDADVVIIRNKMNLGLSESRNVGLDYCMDNYDLNSTFAVFVDSDDYLEQDYLENVVNILENDNCDIICSSLFYTYSNRYFPHILTERNVLINSPEATRTLLLDMKIPSWIPTKVFRLSLFSGIRFPKKRVYYEDRFTTFKLFNKATHIFLTKYIGYYYWQEDSSSITRDKINNKKIMDSLDAYYESVNYKYSNDNKINKELQKAAFNAFIQNALSAIVYFNKKESTKAELSRFKRYRRKVNFFTVIRYKPSRIKLKKKKYYYLLLGPFYKYLYLKYAKTN